MVIASRTPEGLPNRCPVCGKSLRIEPSLPLGDAPCPHCGQLLWFLAGQSKTRFFLPREAAHFQKSASNLDAEPLPAGDEERIIHIVCENLGIDKEAALADSTFREQIRAGELDWVKVVMELEETVE